MGNKNTFAFDVYTSKRWFQGPGEENSLNFKTGLKKWKRITLHYITYMFQHR